MKNIEGFRVILNHFEQKPTFLFKFKNGIVISNGCQTFKEEDKEDVYDTFEVHLTEQAEVERAIESLRDDEHINRFDFFNMIETFNMYNPCDLLPFVDWEEKLLEQLITVERMTVSFNSVANSIYSILNIKDDIFHLTDESITKITEYILDMNISDINKLKLMSSFCDSYLHKETKDIVIKELVDYTSSNISPYTLTTLIFENYRISFMSNLLVEYIMEYPNYKVDMVENLYHYLPRNYERYLCARMLEMLNEYKKNLNE